MKIKVDYKELKKAANKLSNLIKQDMMTKIKQISFEGQKISSAWRDTNNKYTSTKFLVASKSLEDVLEQIGRYQDIFEKGNTYYSQCLNKNVGLAKKVCR